MHLCAFLELFLFYQNNWQNEWLGGFALCVLRVGKMFNQAFGEMSKVWGKQNEGRETFESSPGFGQKISVIISSLKARDVW